MALTFEWDQDKAQANLRKHRVSFDEATSAFDDPLAQMLPDDDHSIEELREILIGHSIRDRLLVISFTERGHNRVRLISARIATRHERKAYEENQGQ
jgi:uncharacterized protein